MRIDLVPRWKEMHIAKKDISIEAKLAIDPPGYEINPHPDRPDKLITFLFYLPDDDRLRDTNAGTKLMVPNQLCHSVGLCNLTDSGSNRDPRLGKWFSWDLFKVARESPFEANSAWLCHAWPQCCRPRACSWRPPSKVKRKGSVVKRISGTGNRSIFVGIWRRRRHGWPRRTLRFSEDRAFSKCNIGTGM